MADVLGVDLATADRSVPFVITAEELPESVLRNAEFVRQTRIRREWRARQARGEVGEGNEPPPGISPWQALERPLMVGAGLGLVLGLLVQLIAKGLGHLFGYRPGPVGLVVGIFGGAMACLLLLSWLEHVRERDSKIVEASQRRITDSFDRYLMVEAHRAATTVVELWPQLPVDEGPVVPRLRRALWALAGVLPERQRLAATLAELRQATVGVPSDDPAAADLAAKIARADALHRAKDAEVRERVGHLNELTARCQRFHDEQKAIRRARQVSRQADAVLGTVATVVQQSTEDIGTFTQHVAAVLDAYRKLGHDVGSDS